ncbi:MAG: DUF6514 family protein [Monoglobales bacterium]
MKKKLYISKKIKGLSGRLDYYLTESKYRDIQNGISTFVFGVEIQKITTDESGLEHVQRKAVEDLSVSKECVLEFLYMLSDMEVMPVSLMDVAEDFVQDDFFINLNESVQIA